MKKFLSLVLALVMTMSLVTVSAGAKDFADSDKIQYTEAVDVMSAVKVIDGYTDGSFNPTATLTRGAAAKIICNLILGPTTAGALVADAAPYKDVPTNHTFAGYIAYCQKEGIISGYADGSFRPANSLTGYAFMKMLLGALGYDAKVEGYTGPNWSVNVAKRALNIGLTDDLIGNFNGVKAVNREEACLYALNTLTANMVEYDAKTSVSTGNTTVVIAGSKAKDMENNNRSTDGNVFKADGIMQFAEKYFTDVTVRNGSDEFERPSNVWKLKAEEIGTYSNTPDQTYTKAVEAGDIYKDLNLGRTVTADAVTVYVNGVEAKDAEIDIKKGSDAKIGDVAGVKTNGNGVLTEVFYNDDADTITITQVVTYIGEINKTVKATDKKDAYVVIEGKLSENNKFATRPVSVTGTNAGALEFETDEKFADETYVLYTYSFKENEVESVAAAQKVEGYVSKTINKVDDEDQNNGMTIASTEYKMSKATAGEKLGNVSVKQDYTVYLDAYGYIIYVEEIQEIGNYALVLATASKGSFIGNKAQLLLTDGKVKFVNTDENYASGSKKIDDNTIVTFRENSDGTYTLKTVKKSGKIATVATAPTAEFNMTSDKAGIALTTVAKAGTIVDGTDVAAGAKTVHANSASVFVVADQADYNATFSEIDDWDAYTGIKNAPSVTNWSSTTNARIPGALVNAYYYCKNSMVTVMFIVPNKLAHVEDGSKNAIYFAKESASDLIHDEEGDYFIYNAVIDGKISTVKVDDDVKMDGIAVDASKLNGLFKSYSTNSKGYITNVKAYDAYTNGNTEQVLNAGIGLAKTSKEYTVTLDTHCTTTGAGNHQDNFHNGTAANGGFVITVDENAKIYYVDKKGNISESSYAGLYPDDNDLVYAVVKDYLVKTLVVEEVKDNETGSTSNNWKPGQKPVATINGTIITVPVFDGDASHTTADAINALSNAGYTVTGSVGSALMASKGGKSYVFTTTTENYVTVKVDDVEKDWVKVNGSGKAVADSMIKWSSISGNGTGYVSGNSYNPYFQSGNTDKVLIAKGDSASAITIDTGYVRVDNSITTSTDGDLKTGTVALVNTKTVGSDTVALYNKLGVEVKIAKGAIGSTDYEVVLKENGKVLDTDKTKQGEDYDVTYIYNDLKADVDASKITVEVNGIKATSAISYPAALENNGVTMTLTGPATATDGQKVTVKATFQGTATGDATFKIGNATNIKWDDSKPDSLDVTNAAQPKVNDGTAYLTPKEVLFTFDMGAADVTITLEK